MSYQDYRMRLWELGVVDGLPKKDDPWGSGWDTAQGFVVRADSEEQARKMANEMAGSENSEECQPWLDSKYTTCEELTDEGESGVVIMDFYSA